MHLGAIDALTDLGIPFLFAKIPGDAPLWFFFVDYFPGQVSPKSLAGRQRFDLAQNSACFWER